MNKTGSGFHQQWPSVFVHLYNLDAYPGGQEAARKLAAYWHVYHKTARP